MGALLIPVRILYTDNAAVYYPLISLFSVVYLVGFWVLNDGQTPGKMAVKARVVNRDGQGITFGQAIVRVLGYYLSTIPLYLGFIWIMIDRKGRGWHDMIASTCVISEEEARPPGW